MKMTIKQLVEEANKLLNDSMELTPNQDKRVKSILTERRVRSYIYSGFLDKPFRGDGKIWYDETHLNKLLAARSLLNNGVSEAAAKSISSIYHTKEDVSQCSSNEAKREKLSSFLNQLNNVEEGKNLDDKNFVAKSLGMTSRSMSFASNSNNLMYSALNTVSKSVVKSFKEYQLDESGKLFLKIEDNVKFKDVDAVLEKIKQILNIKE